MPLASPRSAGPLFWSLLFAGLVAKIADASEEAAVHAAQPESRPDGGTAFEEEIEVSAHYENGIGASDAASAGRVTRHLIEDRPILRPGEVLELVPGLIVTQHSGAGKANQYFLRGFNLDHGTDFATTLDGMPLNLRTHAHGQGYTDLNFLIPEFVSRVDYSKGPYFASKGDFASAGAADIHYATSLPKDLAEVAGGNFAYGRALAAGSPSIAGGHLLYGLEAFHDDGPWDHPDDYRRVDGVLRYTHESSSTQVGVTAMAYYGIWNSTDQVPLRAIQTGVIDRFGAIDATDGGHTYRFSLSGAYDTVLGDGVFEANAYVVRYKLDLFSDFTYFLDDSDHGDQFEQLDDRWMFGTSSRYAWSGQIGWTPVRATVGWEARHDRVDPVGLYATQARERLSTTRQDFVRETSAGGFAEIELRLRPWLRAVGGLRYDEFFFDVVSDRAVNSGRADAGRLSPKLSVIFGPWARTELFANFGFGFHSNDARGVTTTVDPKSGEPVAPVTPLVATRAAEAGVRTQILPQMQASLSLWRLDLDSELLFTGDAGTTEPSRASRRQGVELSAAWLPLRWLLVDLEAAFSRARFTSPDPDPMVHGNFIPGAIGSVISAGVTVHDLGPWTVSLTTRYFGPRPLIQDDSVQSSASTLFNARASYSFSRLIDLSLDIFNLLDAEVDDIAYFYRSRLRDEQAPVQPRVHIHPAESRSARLAIRFTY